MQTADELGKMVFKARISSDTRAYVRLAKEWKRLSAKQIIQRLHISRASLYRILKEDKIREDIKSAKRKKILDAPENWVYGKSNYFFVKSQNWGNQKGNLLWSNLCSKQESVQGMFPSEQYNGFSVAKDTSI